MTMPTDDMNKPDIPPAEPHPAAEASAPLGWVGRIARLLLLVGVLGAGGAISHYWLTNRPKARRRPPRPNATLVEVRAVQAATRSARVRALGTVVPAKTIQLAARVRGEVVAVDPALAPGGQFRAGEVMLRIDPNDYELAVRGSQAEVARTTAQQDQRAAEVLQRESDVTRAESDLAVEMGQQAVAQREYELLGETISTEDRELVLRQPQLRSARAAAQAAKAAVAGARGILKAAEASAQAAQVALETARLDLSRTTIRAPFNATVQSRTADLGAQVTSGVSLATLVGTDEYWVQVAVPVDQLQWIRIPGYNATTPSEVRVYHEAAWGPGQFRAGRVVRLMSDLEPQGRMVRMLVAVSDPLGLKSPPDERHPLILGAYVRVEIVGRDLADVIRVERTALREGRYVWVMTADNTLDVRAVTVVWGGLDEVFVSDGLRAGERLVTSDLAAVVQGMALRTASAPTSGPTTRPGPTSRPGSGAREPRP